MTQPTLFAHLAARPGTGPETVAADVLAFVLTSSEAARTALADLCSLAVPGVPNALQFHSEPADPGQAPALVGVDADGETRIVVESRFWSGLPAARPIRSLRQLSADRPAALLVLAPSLRFTPLWAELRHRCRRAHLPVHGDHPAGDPMRWTRIGPRQAVVLASWSTLLSGIRSRLVGGGEARVADEVDQLAALCRRMDSDAFLPLAPEELSSVSPRRLTQLYYLVDDLVAACEARGLGSPDRPGITAGRGYVGRFLHLSETNLFVCLSVERWATLRDTPFWLLLYDADRRPARLAESRLESLSSEIPPRLLRDPETDCPLVPLFPRLGADRDTVLADLARQVEEVVRLLGESPTTGFGSRRAARVPPRPDRSGGPPER